MHMHQQLLVFATVFCFAIGLDLPPEIKKCKRSGGNTDECLKVAIQDALPKIEKGLPTLGLPPIKPLNIPSMTIGEGSGTVHVVQKYKNVNLFGISDAIVEKVKATITPMSAVLEIDAFLSNLILESEYDFNGRILVLPIVGTGKCTILLKKLKAHLHFSGETFQKKGKKYLEMKDMKLTLNPEKVEYNFENLFNGDERLGTEMNKVLNDNWKDVFEDVRPGYEEALSIIIKSVANTIFTKVPHDELLPE